MNNKDLLERAAEREAGYESEANGVRAASSNLGNIGRELDRKVNQ